MVPLGAISHRFLIQFNNNNNNNNNNNKLSFKSKFMHYTPGIVIHSEKDSQDIFILENISFQNYLTSTC